MKQEQVEKIEGIIFKLNGHIDAVDDFRFGLSQFKTTGPKSGSLEYRNLEAALDLYKDSLEKRVDALAWRKINKKRSDEIAEMQKALNRERKLREKLEQQAREASESSGLFIQYIKRKLKI